MTGHETSSAEFFDRKYREQRDPWDFEQSAYEGMRYDRIVEAVRHRRWRSAFEPGCSIGVLTGRLAAHCDQLTAVDFSAEAAGIAAARCAHLPGVRVECAGLSERADVSGYDLVVLSEIGYYFEEEAWRELCARMVGTMDAGATLVGAHWLGESADHQMHGDTVHAMLREDSRLALQHEERHAAFRLDRWERR
jgi:SAM-dependent methyltransferase